MSLEMSNFARKNKIEHMDSENVIYDARKLGSICLQCLARLCWYH